MGEKGIKICPFPLIHNFSLILSQRRIINEVIMTQEFFMPMAKVPTVTHQEKKVRILKGKPIFYEPVELQKARVKIKSHLAHHTPATPYLGAIRLVVKWLFPITGKHADGDFKITKPDTDNLNKLLKDVMTDLRFWKDDALVCSEIIEKFYARVPGIYICIIELPINKEK